MISLPLYHLPLLYAAVFLAGVLALWLLYIWRCRGRRRDMRQGLSQCRLCSEWLRHGKGSSLVRCPSCGALNERNFINDI